MIQSNNLCKEVSQQLLKITNVKILDPDTAAIDLPSHFSADIEYLTERKPKTILFQVTGTYNGVVEKGAIMEASISDDGGTLKGVVSGDIQVHCYFYNKEDKGVDDKVEYTLEAWLDEDGIIVQAEEAVFLPHKPYTIDLVEIVDEVFNKTSAVPCIDSKGLLITALAQCFKHADEWPDKEVILFGHTDFSSDAENNFMLSHDRIKAIKALLGKDQALWKEIVADAQVMDFQRTLKSIASLYGWSCDPGEISGTVSAQTTEAVIGFQAQYNAEYEGSLLEDGMVGEDTWVAVYDLIWEKSIEASGVTEGDVYITFNTTDGGLYPCGESVTKDSAHIEGLLSESDRRVEVHFFDRPNVPDLEAPAAEADVEGITVYNPDLVHISVLDLTESVIG